LLSKSYGAERRKLIDPNHAAKKIEAGNPENGVGAPPRRSVAASARGRAGSSSVIDDGDTIYMCTADDEGNMVSLIQSNYRGMGSGIVVPGLGFMFQDRGELFSMDPTHANVYAPGKRPFHTIIPGFVMKDGKQWEAFGVMGGGMQPQGHVQVLTNQIDFGLNVQEAGDASRWQHEGDNEPTGEKMTESGGYVEVESGIPYETVRDLRKKGHDVRFDGRRLRRLSGDQSRNARRPARLCWCKRITQRRNGGRLLIPETEKRRMGETADAPIRRLLSSSVILRL